MPEWSRRRPLSPARSLFDRAAARDFVDVANLLELFALDDMLAWAADIDPGLDLGVLVRMLRTLDRFADEEIPTSPAAVRALRAKAEAWAEHVERLGRPSVD